MVLLKMVGRGHLQFEVSNSRKQQKQQKQQKRWRQLCHLRLSHTSNGANQWPQDLPGTMLTIPALWLLAAWMGLTSTA
jgi:hypothetical protein